MATTIYMMTTGPTTVAVPTAIGGTVYNPYLYTSAPSECLESVAGTPRAQLSGGPAAINNGLVRTMMRQAGEVHMGRAEITIGGVDYSDSVIGDYVDLTWGEDDAYQRFTLKLHPKDYSLYLHADADTGKDVVITWIVTEQGDSATVHRIPIFTGKTAEVETDDEVALETTVSCESLKAVAARKDFYRTLRFDGLPYGCVIAGEIVADGGGEFEVTAQNNNTTLLVADGMAGLDTSTIGTPPGNPNDTGRGDKGGVGGPRSSDSVTYVSRAAQTLDLTAQANLTLDNIDGTGPKSVFITNPDGFVVVSDDGPPPGSVPIATFEYRYVGMPITQSDIRDVRPIYFKKDKRRISDVIRYILREGGFSGSLVDSLNFPAVNDDELVASMTFAGKVKDAIDRLCYLARWKWDYDGAGKPYFWLDQISRSGYPHWTYNRNRMKSCILSSPRKIDIAGGGLVVEGMHVDNWGRTQWKETMVSELRLPKPKKSTPGSIGGAYQRFEDVDGPLIGPGRPLEIVKRTETTIYYVGLSEVLRVEKIFEKRNPRGTTDGIGRAALTYGAGGSTPSTEAGVDFKYDEHKLELSRITRWEAYYLGGVFRGFVRYVEEMNDPISLAPGAIGGNSGPGYGWQYDEEKFELVSVELLDIEPTSWGFIASKTSQHWGPGNPSVNHELGKGPAVNVESIGRSHAEEEEMILLLEEITTFKRQDWEWYIIDRDKRGFRKKPSASAHGSIGFGASSKPLGHVQTEVASQEVEFQRLRGQPPTVEGLQDEIRAQRVGSKMLSPTVASAYGDEQLEVIVNHDIQSWEQAERVAQSEWAQRLAYSLVVSSWFNPRLRLSNDVRVQKEVPDGRYVDVTGRPRFIRARVPLKEGLPTHSEFHLKSDHQELADFMAART